MTIDGHVIKINNQPFMQVSIIGYCGENDKTAHKFQQTMLLMASNGIQIINDQLHLGGYIPQARMTEYILPGCSMDPKLNNNNNNNNNNPNNPNINNSDKLVENVANCCNVALSVARAALQASNWDPNIAINRIKTTTLPKQ